MYTAYGVGFRPDGTIGALTPKSQFGGSPRPRSQTGYRYQSQQRMFCGGKGAMYGVDPCGGCPKGSRCICNVNNVCKCEKTREYDLARPTISIMPRQSVSRMRAPVQSATVSRLMRRR